MTAFPDTLLLLLAALLIDAVLGDPDFVWRRWPHPVAWMGALVALCDRRLNRDSDAPHARRVAGVAALVIVLFASVAASLLTEGALRLAPSPLDDAALALAASVLIAQNGLYRHVAAVRDAFAQGGLADARVAASRIVGRDPARLDESGASRAAIESCAENFSDGVVAPAFWLVLFGLPGLAAYKAVNTADSMIGHRSARHRDFGWAAARFDDLANLAPARLSGALIALAGVVAGGRPLHALRVMARDARLHRSPNAGWPEAAMAAALGVALAGPRVYAGYRVDDPFLNAQGCPAAPRDIARALRVFVAACVLHAALYALLAAALL